MSIEKDKTIGQSRSTPEDVSRRLILKGLSAVPAIATLGAAGSVAAASITACTTTPPDLPGGPGDIEAVPEDGDPSYNCETETANIMTSTNWGAVDVEDPIGGGFANDTPLLGTDEGAMADTPATTLGGRRCVLYVQHDQASNAYRLSFDPAVGDPVRASCLASIVGNQVNGV